MSRGSSGRLPGRNRDAGVRPARATNGQDRRRFVIYEAARGEGADPMEAWRRALATFPTRYEKNRMAAAEEAGETAVEISEEYVKTSLASALERFAPKRIEQVVREVQVELARDALGTVEALRQAREGKNADGTSMKGREDAAVGSVRVKAAEVELKALRVIDRGGGGDCGGTNVQVNVGGNADVRGMLEDPELHAEWLRLQKRARGRGKVVEAEAEVREG